MKKKWLILLALSATILLAVACGAELTPTPTVPVPGSGGPTATPVPPTPTATPTPTTPPTPTPFREWALLDVVVDGSTVTVSLQVFAGIDVKVTLDGRPPDEVSGPAPILKHAFKDVAPGPHTVHIQDVVGFSETREVLVPPITLESSLPAWLTDLIRQLENEPVANPPATIARYEYKGQTVYFLPQRCCDIFSNLYDADGNIIGHPDGGITGQGDGRVPDFFEERSNEAPIWKDAREDAPEGMSHVEAPIEGIEQIAESFPLQYFLKVVSGVPNSCHTFGEYTLTRDGVNVLVRVFNVKPTDDRNIRCAQVYGTVDTVIPLGSDYDPDTTYTIDVNGETISFKGDQTIR